MIALIQRVKRSSVKVDGKLISEIGQGLNILLGVFKDDSEKDIEKLVKKVVNLRIFADEEGKMNLSLKDIGAEVLVVSQFTLAGSVKKGRRPSFDSAMAPDDAEKFYEKFCDEMEKEVKVKKGIFGAMMEVEIVNDGPVTFIVDSKIL
ncbi:D-aminoacyl-tRNA deacylase [Nitrosophilus labii]|uniref:D-aminoacyl-tRNA deacylase n=1 Tax=Nitrosophilus labii TaxID=2706014 RepID=UPI001656BAB4|nr:D-aminoacyl-tRNA deacylase [Nitrosophilus labii]